MGDESNKWHSAQAHRPTPPTQLRTIADTVPNDATKAAIDYYSPTSKLDRLAMAGLPSSFDEDTFP